MFQDDIIHVSVILLMFFVNIYLKINYIFSHANDGCKKNCFLDFSKVYGFKPCIFARTNFFNMKRRILNY